MPAGRPPKFSDPAEMQHRINLYFLACKVHTTGITELLDDLNDEDLLIINDIDCTTPTMAGIALTLGMTTESLRNYKAKDEFFGTINKAKQRVTASWEGNLIRGGAGPIFWLKNNADYKDKVTTENINRDATGLSDQQLEDIAAGSSGTID